MHRMNTGISYGLLISVGLLLATLTACTIIRKPDGTIIVTPGPLDPDGSGGVYEKVTVNGHCYWSNGKWCFPCDQGGPAVRCADLIGNPPPPKVDGVTNLFTRDVESEAYQQVGGGNGLSLDLEVEMFRMTGGLSGLDYLILNDWDILPEGQQLDDLTGFLNFYTDDNGADVVDYVFLWSTLWAQPSDPDDNDDVEIDMFIDGASPDSPTALQIIRVQGTQDGVEEVLAPMVAPGTILEVSVPEVGTFTFGAGAQP